MSRQAAQTVNTFQNQLLPAEQFLNIARQVPWGQRPQRWWDLLSIAGGGLSGVLYFLYSSVRATDMGIWFTFLLLVPLALVIAAFVRREKLLQKLPPSLAQGLRELGPAWRRIQNLPGNTKLIGGGAAALGLWAILQRVPDLLGRKEGLDLLTPALMAAIPVALVWFRKEVDKWLAPLHPLREALPLPVRVGLGLAIPFATAYFLYNGAGMRMYPLMHANVPLGTALSYAMVRTPPSEPTPPRRAAASSLLGWLVFLLGLLWALPGWADDFLRDPFNLNDGLRTNGIAPLIAGASTAVVSMLVNGVEVTRVVLQSPTPAGEGETAQHKNFQVVVNTKDLTGASSTTVKAETGGVFIFAHCEEARRRFPAGDPTITFALEGGGDWVKLSDLNMQKGERCAHVTLADPQPASGEPPTSCSAVVSAGRGELISTTIPLTIEKSDLGLVFFH